MLVRKIISVIASVHKCWQQWETSSVERSSETLESDFNWMGKVFAAICTSGTFLSFFFTARWVVGKVSSNSRNWINARWVVFAINSHLPVGLVSARKSQQKIKKGENAEVLTEIFHRRGAQIPRKWKILCNLWFAIFYPPRRFGKKKSIACKCCAFAALEPIFCLSVNVSDSKRFDKWKPISMEISTGWEKCSSRDFSLHHPASFIITIHATTEWYGR